MLDFLRRRAKSPRTNENLLFDYAATLDVTRLRRTIYEKGCVVVRGLISTDDVAVFAGMAERTFDTCRQLVQILEVPEDEPLDRIQDARLRKFVTNIRVGQIEPAYFERLNQGRSIYEILTAHPERRQFLLALFGGEWFPGAAVIRRISPVTSQQSKSWQAPIVMHCDGPILSRHAYSINVWVPMVDCPGEAPGLQLVPGPFEPLRQAMKHDFETSAVDHAIELEMQRQYSAGEDGKPRFVPQLARGDVVIFHNWIMHGSYATSQMTKPRTSFELRFNAPTRDDFEAFAR